MSVEHKLTKGDKFAASKDVCFKKAGKLRFVPHRALIDLKVGSLDVIGALLIGTMAKRNNFVFDACDAGNNWAKAHYTEGAQLIDVVVHVIGKVGESCDCAQRFQITYLRGGGTGSGLATLLLIKMKDNYSDRVPPRFSVCPSPKVSDVVVEQYNTTLRIHQFLENSDETFVIDNGALHDMLHSILKRHQAKYGEINCLISLVMNSGIVASFRFSGKLNGDLRKMCINLVRFQGLHFFAIARAPLFAPGDAKRVKVAVNVNAQDDKYLSASCALGYRYNIVREELILNH